MSNFSFINIRFFITIFLLVFLGKIASTQIVINEVCSSNSNVIEDEFGETSDWIELYNNGNSAINLEDYFLSDNASNLQKWQFPNKIIAPQSYLLIFASNNDLVDIYCHTNFKLSSSGESLTLSDATGTTIDFLQIPTLSEDHSYGRIINGSGNWGYFQTPTPEISNENGSNYEFAQRPTFTTQQYFYETGTTIELTCDEPNCEIRFSRDGSIPDQNSALYSQPISIDTSTCIRAVTFSDTYSPSLPSTQTFFINVPHTLPILTVTSEPDNFWDFEKGIFVAGPEADPEYPHWGANFWKDIEIPIHVEYFKDENLEIKFDVGGKTHGGKSARTKPMKALRLVSDGDFSTEGMNYKFFENKNVDHFHRLILRNASGDFNYTHFRDAYLHRYFLNNNLDLDVLAYQPIVVYINGIYWGVMNLREKIDKSYLLGNYGMHEDSIDLLEEDLVVIEGSALEYLDNFSFMEDNDFSIESNFEQAKEYFDISNLMDYFIVQTFVNNTDFPNNNFKFWQPKAEGGKWRFLLFDMDVGMGRYGWTTAETDNFNWLLDNPHDNKFVTIINAFLENKNFRNQFINRYADLMNTIFREENLKLETENTVASIDDEMVRHFDKWQWYNYDVWQNDRLVGLFDFIEKRPTFQREFVRQQFELENIVQLKINTYPAGAGQVKINTITPEQLPWDGYYYNGVPVEITIIPNNGFTFKNWQSINTILEKNPAPSIIYNFEKDDEITAFFETEYDGLNLSVFPNPIENEFEVNFTLDKISEVDIRLFDSMGRFISEFPQGKRNGGTHTISLAINDLSKGIYFISLQTEEFHQSFKIVK